MTLRKSLLSWPVAATRRTDSAAPTVLANHATIALAVSSEICHSRGSTGTLTEKKKRNPKPKEKVIWENGNEREKTLTVYSSGEREDREWRGSREER